MGACRNPTRPRNLNFDEARIEEASKIYGALSDPLRLRILSILKVQPLCVCVIREIVKIPDSKLSYHLGILKSAGLVESERDGNWIMYSLTELGAEYAKTVASR
jgi:ArsR family transcriptional regulator